MTRPADDTTKPSRLNRRRKKRWKIADLIANGWTEAASRTMIHTAGTSSTGRGNLVSSKGEKSPQSFAAFLCLSFSAALCRLHSVMAGCFGHGSSMAAPLRGFPPHYSPSPDAVESIGGGLILSKGATAMNTPSMGEIFPESNPKTLPQDPVEAIRQKFIHLAACVDMVLHEANHNALTGSALVCLECDAEELVAMVHDLRGQLRGESPERQNSYTAEPRKVSLDDVLAMQAAERGIMPMPLEADLLIQRIEQGGHSGKLLADAFICTYRPHPFSHPLMEINRLDAEGFRLFHQCLHIRHVPNWSDSALYEIEKRVRAAMKVGEKQNKRATRAGLAKAKAKLNGGEQ